MTALTDFRDKLARWIRTTQLGKIKGSGVNPVSDWDELGRLAKDIWYTEADKLIQFLVDEGVQIPTPKR